MELHDLDPVLQSEFPVLDLSMALPCVYRSVSYERLRGHLIRPKAVIACMGLVPPGGLIIGWAEAGETWAICHKPTGWEASRIQMAV